MEQKKQIPIAKKDPAKSKKFIDKSGDLEDISDLLGEIDSSIKESKKKEVKKEEKIMDRCGC